MVYILAEHQEYYWDYGHHKHRANQFRVHKLPNELHVRLNHYRHLLGNAIHFQHYYQYEDCMIFQNSPTNRKKFGFSIFFFSRSDENIQTVDAYLFTATMLFWTNAPTFTSSTTSWTRMNTAVFCYPIPFTYTLMSNTFASIRAIIRTVSKKKERIKFNFYVINI